ncbi:hypothetical protein BCS96_04340 [Vibrio breoganii]|uniref:Sbal_3080 family lipoprotein n=1 Tax=Vibrio breoganii TaxID=553239 RepID=UPI000C861CC7|nr:Sbal_3080 family lipoprotein [Vibrio breoganii]PMG34561.1 hypothetical protein BCU93_18340 [Vibrio breoganii]PMG82087.1 hypothetical protein BCU81_16765 [Vibrio breoganii]PMG93262.1 hypothetical protein BCU80_08500 [Vibrio breoganii]PML82608.1 hypothetical protein BCT68_12065 [Vibrio breoganii]PMM50176.1 hypothetical protein BCT52_02805 [Vibrio breoganii]
MNKLKFHILIFGVLLSGCTSITVEPISSTYSLENICIERNSKVIVEDFLSVVQNRFNYHGINTKVVDFIPASCKYKMTYTALRSWDIVPYLSHAELRIFEGNQQIAYGEYHLTGKGGLDMSKFDGVEEKMNPVIDKMLAQ